MATTVQDNVQLVTAAPTGVTGFTGTVVGPPGPQTFWYWFVTEYPIGTIVNGPIIVRNAPQPFTASNFVRLGWQTAVGSEMITILRTNSPELPKLPANIVVASFPQPGATNVNDMDAPLAELVPGAINVPTGAPSMENLYLNNRDREEPFLDIFPWPIRVEMIIFPDGTTMSTVPGGGGQNQTPWLTDIDGDGFDLTNVGNIQVNGNIDASSFTINGEPFTGSQTPWTSNIDAAGFALNDASSINAPSTGGNLILTALGSTSNLVINTGSPTLVQFQQNGAVVGTISRNLSTAQLAL